MARVTCFWLFLVHLYQTQVQSSVAPVYLQKGKDVLLDVNNVPEQLGYLEWNFDKKQSFIITFFPGLEPRISKTYTERIDVPEKNKYSVILKNLQETDSGVYTAHVLTEERLPIAQHNIIVQDVVSPVMLTVNSVSNSSDSCNVTLTCSAADSHISSTVRCVNQKCDQDGGNQSKITNSSATLEVYLMNVQVICKHSNRVSSTNNMTDIKYVCPYVTGTDRTDRTAVRVPVVVVVVVVVVLVVVLVIGVILAVCKKKQDVTEDFTIYAVPVVEKTDVPDDAPDGGEALDCPSLSIYSLAGPHKVSSGDADTADKPHTSLII